MEKELIDFSAIEKKWQNIWEEKKVFVADESSKKKMYVLEMFPYPSGSGLHMGHAFNYTIGDIQARLRRMQGFSVLYPMGYDSFGLPAENAAIKEKTHPGEYTNKTVANFVRQQKELGLSYDWSKMFCTSDEDYYKWNQYFFLKFLEKGLVYRKKASVNWCPKCNTVLANEQVHNGRCWRHEDTEVILKPLEQWFLKTTDYAEELLEKVDSLDWPNRIKAMQKNWIGKSEGTEVDFEIESDKGKISNVVIVHGSNAKEREIRVKYNLPPQNERDWIGWIKGELDKKEVKCKAPLMPESWKPDYEKWKKEFEKINIDEDSILIGHSSGGAFLIRWLGDTNRKVKKLILVAPGICVKGKEDWETDGFHNFKINRSIKNNVGEIILIQSDNDNESILDSCKACTKELGVKPTILEGKGHFTGRSMGTNEFPELLGEIIGMKKWKVFTTRVDTLFGVTFLVVSSQHPELMNLVTDSEKEKVEEFLKKVRSTKQEDLDKLEKEGAFTGSYAVHPLTGDKIPIWTGNFVLAEYGSGMVMADAHDQRDLEFAQKYGIPLIEVITPESGERSDPNTAKRAFTGYGVLVNSEGFDGLKSSEAIEHIRNALDMKGKGRKTVNYKLRDWLVSRQRYWGTPIPVIYCDDCGIVPVSEKDLPVTLPEDVKFGEGNPLATNEDFVNVDCPKCGGRGRRETDTMDTFFDSSWYFLRFIDSHNSKVPFDKKKVSEWMPVHTYIGGAEHACMHLIYSRFFVKALRDLGFLSFDEPFKKLFNQGMLHGDDGHVMSKSRGNVVIPEEVSKNYGIDTARFFLVSVASPDKDIEWSQNGIEGSLRFVLNVFDFADNFENGKMNPLQESKFNRLIKSYTSDLEDFRYNLAMIKLREIFDVLKSGCSKEDFKKFLQLLSPVCPHIAEELWSKFDSNLVCLSSWPEADESKINEKLEEQEKQVEKTVEDVKNILNLIKEKQGKEGEKIYLYVLPNEKERYSNASLSEKVGKEVKVFAVNDSDKHDPENKSSKVKPGRPGIYVE